MIYLDAEVRRAFDKNGTTSQGVCAPTRPIRGLPPAASGRIAVVGLQAE